MELNQDVQAMQHDLGTYYLHPDLQPLKQDVFELGLHMFLAVNQFNSLHSVI